MRVAQLALHTSLLATPGGYKTGGMNVYVRELSRQLVQSGSAVDIYTRRVCGDEPKIVEMADGTRVIHLDHVSPDVEKDDLVAAAIELADEIAAFAAREGLTYDVVHSHYWVSGPTGVLLSGRWGVPHVVMFHTLGEVKNRVRAAEMEPRIRIDSERATVAAADRIVCASKHEALLLERLYDARPERISVIPCGVDLQRFHPGEREDARVALGLGDEPIVLYVGRIEPLKGVDLLISAFAQVEGAGTLPHLLVLGGDDRSGEAIRELRGLAAALGVADRVTFAGSVPHDELPAYYRLADVCVVPSFYESFGLVAVEALASGTPVVASRVGGLITTVRDGVTGYLVPWRCPEPFAERIDLLLANAHLRRSMRVAARASVETLGWDRVGDGVRAMYREALAERQRRLA